MERVIANKALVLSSDPEILTFCQTQQIPVLPASGSLWRKEFFTSPIVVNTSYDLARKIGVIEKTHPAIIGPANGELEKLMRNFGTILWHEQIPMWNRDSTPWTYLNCIGRTFNGKDWTGEPYSFTGKTSSGYNRIFTKLLEPIGKYLQVLNYHGPFMIQYSKLRFSNLALAPEGDLGYTGYLRRSQKRHRTDNFINDLVRDCL